LSVYRFKPVDEVVNKVESRRSNKITALMEGSRWIRITLV
jgi:hypothetical protein